jgi:hypothetical protein
MVNTIRELTDDAIDIISQYCRLQAGIIAYDSESKSDETQHLLEVAKTSTFLHLRFSLTQRMESCDEGTYVRIYDYLVEQCERGAFSL